ncbi:hypothetical protein C0993_008249 [Termitomyces sp. T159_Od127]|nr:hypothetical protein C0993_008249 [Termitomyces sp. T159_Od127]
MKQLVWAGLILGKDYASHAFDNWARSMNLTWDHKHHHIHFLRWAQTGQRLNVLDHQQYNSVITPMEHHLLFMTEEERFQALVEDLEDKLFHNGDGEFTNVAVAFWDEQRALGLYPW